MTAIDDLLFYIFSNKESALYSEFEDWVRGSRRFRSFAVTYRDKIRAKVKNARDESGVKDLRAELETAALLLREERFSIEYEIYTALKQRGPDFTVIFKTHTQFNVEVRRIRNVQAHDGETEAYTAKLIAVLTEKVGQMPPGIVNLLWLVDESEITEADLTLAVTALRQMAERKVEDFFVQRGFESAADFLKQLSRLSGIFLRQPGENSLWLNPTARHKVAPQIVSAIRRV